MQKLLNKLEYMFLGHYKEAVGGKIFLLQNFNVQN